MSWRSHGGGSSLGAAAARWPDPAGGVGGICWIACFWASERRFDKTTTVLPYGLLYQGGCKRMAKAMGVGTISRLQDDGVREAYRWKLAAQEQIVA